MTTVSHLIAATRLMFLFAAICAGCSGGTSNTASNSGTTETTAENTSRSGNISSNERWKGTILVTGDVNVQSGATLTIEAGTTVKFVAGTDDRTGGSTAPITDPPFPNDPTTAHSQMSSLNVYGGSVVAVGTAASPIVFTSAATSPKWGDWDSIQFNQAGSKLTLQYAVVEYGYYGVAINAAADDSVVTVKDNTIRHVVACGICGSPLDTVTLTVSGNDISYCGHEGIATFSKTTFVVENNTFHDNVQSYGDGAASVAVNVEDNSSTIRNNTFRNNYAAIGILTAASTPTTSGNTFSGNTNNCAGYCSTPLQ